jgi:SAM-dependent methyltransferase
LNLCLGWPKKVHDRLQIRGFRMSSPPPDDWAGERGERWLRDVDVMEAMLAPIGEAALAAAAHRPGERVLDIGCGGGWTTRRIGEAVGPTGVAVGLDISAALVAEAALRASHLSQVHFIAGDAAAAQPPQAPFDRLFSRFGVMFFSDPPAAFRHLHGLLTPGAKVDLAVWANPKWNPWMMEMRRVVGAHVELPSAEPLAPGPFQLADPDYHGALLVDAGFTGLDRRLLELPLLLGGPGATAQSAAAFALGAFSVGELAEAAGPDVLAAVTRDLEQLYEAATTADGVAMPAAVWLLSAQRT